MSAEEAGPRLASAGGAGRRREAGRPLPPFVWPPHGRALGTESRAPCPGTPRLAGRWWCLRGWWGRSRALLPPRCASSQQLGARPGPQRAGPPRGTPLAAPSLSLGCREQNGGERPAGSF